MVRYVLFMLGLILGPASAIAAPQPDGLAGKWVTQDREAVIEFYPCDGDVYCGRFFWLQEDSAETPSLDERNPDPALKTRPLCGLEFLGGFSDQGEGDYGSGWIYSPRHGAKFSASIRLLDQDKLELRGFMFVPFLGSSEVWLRQDHSIACDGLKPLDKDVDASAE